MYSERKRYNEGKGNKGGSKKMRKSKGITLIALVITIIVLLILAGVSLSLITGSDGILKKATVATDKNEVESAKEQAELLVADCIADFYEEKYGNGRELGNAGTYVKDTLTEGKEVGRYWIKTQDSLITVYKNEEQNRIVDGIIEDNGKITWNNQTGNETKKTWTVTYETNGGEGGPASQIKIEGQDLILSEIIPTKEGNTFQGWAIVPDGEVVYQPNEIYTNDEMLILYAIWQPALATSIIQPENYGETVNYSANNVRDWKIFLNDQKNIYLITTDYVENSKLNYSLGVSGTEIRKQGMYGVYEYSSKETLTAFKDWMCDENCWNSWASGFSGAKAKGGVSLEEFVKSYNGKYKTSYSEFYNQSDWNLEDISDSLYVIQSNSKADGYWLASDREALGSGIPGIWTVKYNGSVCVNNSYMKTYGIRPVVCLPQDVKMNWNGNSWDLSM